MLYETKKRRLLSHRWVLRAGVCGTAILGLSVSTAAMAGAKTLPTVKIDYVAASSDLEIPLIAQEAGLFKKYGVNVEVSLLPQAEAFPALVAGQIQMVVFQAPAPEIDTVSGTKVQWLAQWEHHSNEELLGRGGVTSVVGLAGKIVGISSPGSTSDVLARLALQKANVTATFQPVGSGSAQDAAFAAGSIQATLAGPPQNSTLLSQVSGSKVLVNYKNEFSWPGAGITALPSWASANSATTVKVLEGLIAGINYAKTHAAASAKILAAADDETTAQALVGYKATMALVNQVPSLVPNLPAEKSVLGAITGEYPAAKSATPTEMFNSTYITKAQKTVHLSK